MIISETEIGLFIQQYFLPFARISTMFMVMPILGSKIVTPRIRLVLAFLTTLLVVPLLPEIPAVPALSWNALFIVIQELAIGLCVGFTFQIVFQVFVLAGQIMAMKMGLGFASMNDPTNGVQTTALSQFFLMLVTLIFVSADGHLVLLALLVESFQTFVPGQFVISQMVFSKIALLGGWMFASALVMALPVTTALLLVNITFGVMSRSAPQLNIFAVGFPFTLICGLFLVWVGLQNFLPAYDRITEYGFYFVQDILNLK